LTDPTDRFPGTILIIVPHMDDEVLGCGGLIAKLPRKERIHLIYATDGMKSPSPIIPGRDLVTPDLGEVRINESRTAMSILGVPGENLHFLRLPEGQLKRYREKLKQTLWQKIEHLKPNHIFIPFRFDRHPDHLNINQVITTGYNQGIFTAPLIEYFIYYRWKLLPAQDIRKYIKPQYLLTLNIDDVAKVKRMALDCFKSQTTIFYPWQTRPILTSTLLDEECQNQEYFLLYDSSVAGTAVFTKAVPWIRVTHRFEPFLKKWKYLTGAFLYRVLKNRV
jgi:LmbE family N-acetylglucosaminyl deacetylase